MMADTVDCLPNWYPPSFSLLVAIISWEKSQKHPIRFSQPKSLAKPSQWDRRGGRLGWGLGAQWSLKILSFLIRHFKALCSASFLSVLQITPWGPHAWSRPGLLGTLRKMSREPERRLLSTVTLISSTNPKTMAQALELMLCRSMKWRMKMVLVPY